MNKNNKFVLTFLIVLCIGVVFAFSVTIFLIYKTYKLEESKNLSSFPQKTSVTYTSFMSSNVKGYEAIAVKSVSNNFTTLTVTTNFIKSPKNKYRVWLVKYDNASIIESQFVGDMQKDKAGFYVLNSSGEGLIDEEFEIIISDDIDESTIKNTIFRGKFDKK